MNLVPLEALHTLPKAGDMVLLPGMGGHDQEHPQHAAYRVEQVESIYARVESRQARHGQARLARAVAHVHGMASQIDHLSGGLESHLVP